MKRFVLPCRAATLRGLIRHSHLQNRFLASLPDKADDLRVVYGLESKNLAEFTELLDEMISCLQDEKDGFSAVSLVETLTPLRSLPESARGQLRQAITNTYRAEFQPSNRAVALRSSADLLIGRLKDFLDGEDSDPREVELLRDASVDLYHLITNLPKGIWLWPATEAAK